MQRTLILLAVALAASASRVEAAPEPAVVAAVRSVDRTLETMDHLLSAGGVSHYSNTLRGVLTGLQELQGLDRSRPLGLMLFFEADDPAAEPQPLVLVPIEDIADFQALVTATGNRLTPDPATPESLRPRYELKLGNDRMTLEVFDRYALISPEQRLSPRFDAGWIDSRLSESLQQFDAALAFRAAGVPPELRQRLLDRIARDAAKEQQTPRPGESDREREFRVAVEQELIDVVHSFILQTREVHLGWRLLPEGTGCEAAAELRCQSGGTLAALVQQTFAPPRRIHPAAIADAPLGAAVSMQLTGRGRELAAELVRRIAAEAAPALQRDLPANDAAAALQALDSLEATAAEGRLEAVAQLRKQADGRFVFVAGAAIEQAESIDSALRALLPHAARDDDVRSVTLDAAQAARLPVHRIRGMKVRPQDVQLYGEEAAAWLAAGRNVAWLAVGGDAAPQTLASMIEAAESVPAGEAAAQLHLRLRPWADWARTHGGGGEKRFAQLVQEVFADRSDDHLQARLSAGEDRLRLEVRLEEGLLQVLARSIAAAARERKQRDATSPPMP